MKRKRIATIRLHKTLTGAWVARSTCPETKERRKKLAGKTKREADQFADTLKLDMAKGNYGTTDISFDEFVDRHIATIPGKRNAIEAGRSLREFGRMTGVRDLHAIRYDVLEGYVQQLRELRRLPKKPNEVGELKNSAATIGKKLTYPTGRVESGH